VSDQSLIKIIVSCDPENPEQPDRGDEHARAAMERVVSSEAYPYARAREIGCFRAGYAAALSQQQPPAPQAETDRLVIERVPNSDAESLRRGPTGDELFWRLGEAWRVAPQEQTERRGIAVDPSEFNRPPFAAEQVPSPPGTDAPARALEILETCLRHNLFGPGVRAQLKVVRDLLAGTTRETDA